MDRLVDELWGEQPPDTATKTVQVYVSRLRKELGRASLLTRGGGYVLDIEPTSSTPSASSASRPRGATRWSAARRRSASELLRQALDLWRGPALDDLAYEPFAQTTSPASRSSGWSRSSTHRGRPRARKPRRADPGARDPGARASGARAPARQLMLALYRSGRQTDALASYRDARRALVEELGLEPSRELQELERAILAQDPALDAPARARPVRAGREPRRGGVVLGLGGGLLLAAALAAVFAGGDEPSAKRATANSLAVIDPGIQPSRGDHPHGRPADRRRRRRGLHLGREPGRRHGDADRSAPASGRQHHGAPRERRRSRGGRSRRLDRRRTRRLVRLDPAFRPGGAVHPARVRPPRGLGPEHGGPRLRLGVGRKHLWRDRASGP